MFAESLRKLLKKCKDLLIAPNRLDLSLHTSPPKRRKFGRSTTSFVDRKYKVLHYPQPATLKVKNDSFEVIYRKK